MADSRPQARLSFLIRQNFPPPDLTFSIGGNKYRLIARVDFEEQLLVIQTVLTHQEYDREDL